MRLAEEEAGGSPKEMTGLYLEGVAAGERAIGRRALAEHAGRYHLAACLLEAGRDDGLAELLSMYEDDASAVWVHSRALLEFRRGGGEGDGGGAEVASQGGCADEARG